MKENDILQAQDVRFRYDTEQPNFAVDGVSMEVHRGEFVAVLGANGCGKSTLAKHFNAILLPESGTVLVEDMDTRTDEKLYDIRQKVGMVFQNPDNQIVATVVEEDVAFALENLGVPTGEMRTRVDDAMKLAGIYEQRNKAPHKLSGGQKQRVAIARALVTGPSIICMDEPLSNLDAKLRVSMRTEIRRIQQATGITAIYVTHDQSEAMALSDSIIIMNKGVVAQIGSPQEIYYHPNSEFVADFIGESNILDGIMLEDRLVKFFGRKFKCVDFGFEKNEPVDVVIRPEDIDIVAPDDGHLCGTVTSVTFKGVHYDTIVDFKGFKWLIQTTDFYEVGSYIGIRLEPEDIHIMHKSEYSGMFGDYSSYSAEYDEMDDPDLYPEDAEESEEASEGGEDEE